MRHRAAGFTLLEIMIVMVIISMIVGIAIPRVNDLFEVNLKSSMRKIAGAVAFCFNESVVKQSPLRLNFNLDTGEYWLSFLAMNGSTGEFVDLPTDLFGREQLPDGVYFRDIATPHSQEKRTDGEEFIAFFPTGFVERAVIHIASQDGRVYTMLVKPMTGKISILDGDIDFVDLGPQLTGTEDGGG